MTSVAKSPTPTAAVRLVRRGGDERPAGSPRSDDDRPAIIAACSTTNGRNTGTSGNTDSRMPRRLRTISATWRRAASQSLPRRQSAGSKLNSASAPLATEIAIVNT